MSLTPFLVFNKRDLPCVNAIWSHYSVCKLVSSLGLLNALAIQESQFVVKVLVPIVQLYINSMQIWYQTLCQSFMCEVACAKCSLVEILENPNKKMWLPQFIKQQT